VVLIPILLEVYNFIK